MDRIHSLFFTVTIAAVTAVVGIGGLVMVLKGPSSGEGEEISGGQAEGLADREGDDLGLAQEPEGAGRPVLQVIDPSAGGAGSMSDSGPDTPDAAEDGSTATTTLSSSSSVPGSSELSSTTSTPSTTGPMASTADSQTSPSPSTAPPTSTSTSPGGPEADELSKVEVELARLTNELRANPNGPLKRVGPVIDCGGQVPIDPDTGLYEPVPTLLVHEAASLEVARPWSAQLTTDLRHQPQAGVAALQEAGVAVRLAGENVAYHNFPEVALRHFEGWRESDGHFCNMMEPSFTHLAVGEHTRADGYSFATQNFFSVQ